MLAGSEFTERIRARAEIVVIVSEIGLGADQADLELAGAPALADTRVEDGGFLARVGTDDQQRIGLLDPGNGRIEDPGRPSRLGVKGVAALHRQIAGTVLAQEIPKREHLLDRGEITGDGPDPLAVAHPDLGCDRRKSFLP